MNIYDGSIKDKYNFPPKQYLQINSCGFQIAKTGFTVVRQNGRDDYQLLLILSGTCQVEYDGKKYTMEKGNFLLYPPNIKQYYSFPPSTLSLWCHFTGNVIDEIFGDCGLSCGVFKAAYDQHVVEAFYALINRFHSSNDSSLTKASLIELLSCISPEYDTRENMDDKRISDVLTFMHTHYSDPITVDDLAKRAGYSKCRFNSIFKSSVGCTPIQYLKNIRLSFAADLLSATTLSIGEIAASCGFNDSLYFSRAFSQKYQCSPSEYRLIEKTGE